MFRETTLEYLQNIPLFEVLSPSECEVMLRITKIKTFAPGEILYYEKDQQNVIYYLKEGLIKVYKIDRFDNEVFMYNLFHDTLISEITDFESIGCFANAEFVVKSEVLIIDFEGFKQIYANSPAFMLVLLKEFAKKNKMLQCIINREIVFDGTAKVAFMLVNDLSSFNRLKKQEIAYMLNIQPETLSRILKKLVRNGVIDSQGGDTVILDPNALHQIFE